MSRRKFAVLVGSLALAAGGVLAVPATVAGAASSRSAAHQHAVCAAAALGYARCLANVVDAATSTSGGATPQGHRPGPSSTTPHGYSPATIASAYGFGLTGGAGQTIAIVDAYGAPTIASNLQSFSAQYGLPSCTTSNGCFTKVNQTGGTSYPRGTSGWGLEQSLDVEWAHSLAPKAKVLLVEATTASFTNLLNAVRYAASHASYVSMSWGGTEFSGETSSDSAYFSAPGVSYFAAAGDTGSQVIYPSVSPNVISVGGTTLTVTAGRWKSETAWKTAGGGCSRYETANPVQSADTTYANVGCGGSRATPDLSLDANPTTGVSVYDTRRLSTGQSGWLQVGGTSASTVMVAAHDAETASPLTASTVYGGSLAVYDVTSGTNGHPCTSGYDLCTGIGSWNTAVGNTSGGSSGTLSFTPATSQTLTAGSASSAMTVDLSAPGPPAGLAVSLTTATGGFATSSTGPFSSPLALDVTGSSRVSPTFYFESTTSGQHTITASASNWTPATQTETVTAAQLASITVSPGTATVAQGGTQAFSATGTDAYGNRVTVTTASWTVSTAALGSASPASGSSTTFRAGTTAGTGTVTAATGLLKGTASVTVTAAAPLSASIRAGTPSKHGLWWHTPLTVDATQGGKPVSGATVDLTVRGGPSCSTPEARGTGTTGANGTLVFTFKTRSTGTYCAVASVSVGAQSTSTPTTHFHV
ncbi:MAG TPA: S53 family peptidase [Acidimicrobiales bacterium]|nr:S53 family peptidase [Acidimicrobiales bacterium]